MKFENNYSIGKRVFPSLADVEIWLRKNLREDFGVIVKKNGKSKAMYGKTNGILEKRNL